MLGGVLTSKGNVAVKEASLKDEAQNTGTAHRLLLPSCEQRNKWFPHYGPADTGSLGPIVITFENSILTLFRKQYYSFEKLWNRNQLIIIYIINYLHTDKLNRFQ